MRIRHQYHDFVLDTNKEACFSKVPRTFRARKASCFQKLKHDFNVRKTKKTAKFDGLEPRRCGNMKGIVAREVSVLLRKRPQSLDSCDH